MSIFRTAYDTVGAAGYRLKEIEDKLKVGHVSRSFSHKEFKLSNFDETFQLEMIEGGNMNADNIPYFNHPVFVRDPDSKRMIGYVDARNYGKWYQPQMTFIIRNHPEYNWHLLRGILNHIWLQERVELLRDVSTLPAGVYAALFSESITRKYALDPNEQAIISVVACYFYYSLFTDDKTFDEMEFNKITGKIAQITKVPATKVFEILDEVHPIHGLEALCEVIKEKTKSVRLVEFNVGVLLAIISGNWYGTNARENLAVALEHIPTWLLICYASINEATFKRSIIAKLVERFAKGNAGSTFVKSMNNILDYPSVLAEQSRE